MLVDNRAEKQEEGLAGTDDVLVKTPPNPRGYVQKPTCQNRPVNMFQRASLDRLLISFLVFISKLLLPFLASSNFPDSAEHCCVGERRAANQELGGSKLFMQSALAGTAVSTVGAASHLYLHCEEKIQSIKIQAAHPRNRLFKCKLKTEQPLD